MENKYFYGVGRRKACSARAKYFPGAGELAITVNKKPIAGYFQDFYLQTILVALTNMGISTGTIELYPRGGGISGQAEACRLAITKSLVKLDEAYKPIARLHGYMTTDMRKVLPKMPGRRKARKVEQWSKR